MAWAAQRHFHSWPAGISTLTLLKSPILCYCLAPQTPRNLSLFYANRQTRISETYQKPHLWIPFPAPRWSFSPLLAALGGSRALLGLTTPMGGIFFLILLSAQEFCSFCFFSPQKARRSGESYTLNGRSLERLSPPRKPHRMLLDVSMLWVTDKSRRRTSNHTERAGREKRHMESVSQSGDSAHSGNGTKTRMWESTKSIY